MDASNERLIQTLVEFFLDQFSEDAIGVAEWLAQGGQDADDFVPSVERLRTGMSS